MEDHTLQLNGAKIHYIEEGIGIPVLLLHGARFNATTWVETGTVRAISEAGYRAVSLDLPGYGKSERGSFGNFTEFLHAFISQQSLREPILLGASMGGALALDYALRYSVKGLILVGAVGVAERRAELVSLKEVPSLLIWGKRDSVSPPENYRAYLGAVPGAVLRHVGDQHACYLDDPISFNRELTGFLKGLK